MEKLKTMLKTKKHKCRRCRGDITVNASGVAYCSRCDQWNCLNQSMREHDESKLLAQPVVVKNGHKQKWERMRQRTKSTTALTAGKFLTAGNAAQPELKTPPPPYRPDDIPQMHSQTLHSAVEEVRRGGAGYGNGSSRDIFFPSDEDHFPADSSSRPNTRCAPPPPRDFPSISTDRSAPHGGFYDSQGRPVALPTQHNYLAQTMQGTPMGYGHTGAGSSSNLLRGFPSMSGHPTYPYPVDAPDHRHAYGADPRYARAHDHGHAYHTPPVREHRGHRERTPSHSHIPSPQRAGQPRPLAHAVHASTVTSRRPAREAAYPGPPPVVRRALDPPQVMIDHANGYETGFDPTAGRPRPGYERVRAPRPRSNSFSEFNFSRY